MLRTSIVWIPHLFLAFVLSPLDSKIFSQDSTTKIEFQRDIQPILAEHCSHCHGVDASTREGGLRLDVQQDAFRGGDSGVPAIKPGKAPESELVKRIHSMDADSMMPPPSEKKPLSAAQKELLEKWINQGADYQVHWAFVAPKKLPLPEPTKNPIDAWVDSQLQTQKLKRSPKADPIALCRRLYLDLVGLPPSPQEVDAFMQQGLEATVETLLKSERYGEKWARHWLDAARYSDTNGYEKDLQRQQWAWRDWVIQSINRDMPYDQFIIEQIAGDLLENPTQDQIIATGFLRNSMLNEEGAIVPEQFRMVEMFDRIDCIGKSILGMSTQCAQCHTHKFDPITHDEYYGMFAFLNDTYEAQSWVYSPEQEKQLQQVANSISAVEEKLKGARPSWKEELTAFEKEIQSRSIDWKPITFHQLESISGLNHPVQQKDLSILMLGHTSNDIFFVGNVEMMGATGVRLEALTHGDLPFRGPGRSGLGTWGITEFEVLVKRPDATDWEKQKLVNASADFSEADQKLDAKKSRGPVAYLIDGTDETDWHADRGVGRRNQPSEAVIQFEKPLDLPAGSSIKVVMRMNDMLGCCRISLTQAASPTASNVDYSAALAALRPESERSNAEQSAILAAWYKSNVECKPFSDEVEALWKQYPNALTSILHTVQRPASDARPTFLLDRGNWDQPKMKVDPKTPIALHPLEGNDSQGRLAFARWLASSKSPLTARVAVNRLWQVVWGEGLVITAEDFGTRAPLPEHPELLDWLAVDFMEHNWSQKHILKMIVTSETYQQSSRATAEILEKDPRNRLLARGPRFRADAEVVRDIALTASGLIYHRFGGPGVIPPVPQNVLDYNYTYPSYWTPAQGQERYRRAVYGFRKRSMPDPVMSNFDAPNGDFSCARRVRSNTPLAALTSLNEPIFVEAAQALAIRLLKEGGSEDSSRADYAFRLCTGRLPTADERQEILTLLQSRRTKIAEGWLNPREIATGDPKKIPELPPNTTPQDAAAWTLVARVLLNLDETLTKN